MFSKSEEMIQVFPTIDDNQNDMCLFNHTYQNIGLAPSTTMGELQTCQAQLDAEQRIELRRADVN